MSFVHSIRNAKCLSPSDLERVSQLPSEEKMKIIIAYNSTLQGLNEFIKELMQAFSPRLPAIPEQSPGSLPTSEL